MTAQSQCQAHCVAEHSYETFPQGHLKNGPSFESSQTDLANTG